MKKVFLLTMLIAMFASVNSFASSSKYKIDEAAIDQVFETGVNVLSLEGSSDLMDINNITSVKAGQNAWIAVILDLLIGGLAIHRVYLGGTPILILGYLLTFGGIFGLVPFIDLIVLIINNQDISKYIDNNAFFMW
ncbi:NINE protein [Fulvivirga lutimaris]|uniref:NINE protein n=1 Tax=Fulvivirga lutimaris TaxID=1819566 RepID=UPI0012BBE8F5|nr:TM2 domain-containing protein [Fulvivirga lutimaris]MTI38999.1 TM2 domain-containing protein [Fulvivirga lutimaris]